MRRKPGFSAFAGMTNEVLSAVPASELDFTFQNRLFARYSFFSRSGLFVTRLPVKPAYRRKIRHKILTITLTVWKPFQPASSHAAENALLKRRVAVHALNGQAHDLRPAFFVEPADLVRQVARYVADLMRTIQGPDSHRIRIVGVQRFASRMRRSIFCNLEIRLIASCATWRTPCRKSLLRQHPAESDAGTGRLRSSQFDGCLRSPRGSRLDQGDYRDQTLPQYRN